MSYLEPPDPQPHDVRCQSLCTSRIVDGRCAWKHFSHECDCDEIAASIAEKAAEAFADWEQAAYEAWERNNG